MRRLFKVSSAIFALTIIAGLVGIPAELRAAGSISVPEADVEEDFKRAVGLVKDEKYRQAIRRLEDVLKEKPRHADALNYMGFSYRKSGKYNEAVRYYRLALDVDADHRGANEYLGQAHLETGDLAGAEQRLAALKRICAPDCDEYQSLKKSVEAFRAGNKPAKNALRW